MGIHFVVGRVLHMDRFHSSNGIRFFMLMWINFPVKLSGLLC
jgi:hypothetical protein